MALIHDDQVKEIRGVFTVESGSAFVTGDCLVDRKVHFPALVGHPSFNFPACIAERRVYFCHRIIDKDIAISKIENSGSSEIPRSIPPR